MKLKSALVIAKLAILACAPLAIAQSIPAVKTKALDDSEVVLPGAGGQQILILVIGFSHKGGDLCGAWGKHISADYQQNPRVNHYQMAQLQDAPPFIRGMIVRGIKKQTAPADLPHFVPLYDRGAEWKKAVNFSAPDDPYVIIADSEGRIVWQAHGAFSDSVYADLKKVMAGQLEKSPGKPM